jgi:hypothetical protein
MVTNIIIRMNYDRLQYSCPLIHYWLFYDLLQELQAWTGPKRSTIMKLTKIPKLLAPEGGKVVSSKHLPPLPPGDIPSTLAAFTPPGDTLGTHLL